MIWVWTIFSITFALAESTVRKKRSDWVAKIKILDAYDARKANFEFTGTQVPDWCLVTTKTHYIYFLRTHTIWSIEVWIAQARDWPAIKRQLDRSTRTSLNGVIEISRFHRLRTYQDMLQEVIQIASIGNPLLGTACRRTSATGGADNAMVLWTALASHFQTDSLL